MRIPKSRPSGNRFATHMPRSSARRTPIARFKRLFIVAAGLLILVVLVPPAWHLVRAAFRDKSRASLTPAGFADDASRLNQTAISEVVEVVGDAAQAEAQLAQLLQRARSKRLRVSIAGARHTMGGHTIYPGGIAIDMRKFEAIELDEVENILHVQAGARWDQIIPYLDQRGRSVEIMQSNNSFTVGGSISANCHGWQPNRPPIASSVLSFRLMRADGLIVHCSRDENPELFSLALGGYGLFGIILDVDLRVVPNERYRLSRFEVDAMEVNDIVQREVSGNPAVGMAYARLSVAPDEFLEQAIVNVFLKSPGAPEDVPALSEPAFAELKRAVFRGSTNSDYGKELRWNAELLFSDRLVGRYVSRNQLLNDPVELYQNDSPGSVDILHEYFIPPAAFDGFLQRLREIIPRHRGDLLNVTVRHVVADDDSFLRYADGEMLALVLLFNQKLAGQADVEMEAMTRELIDAALSAGGRHYLPYRLHATIQQFDAAYPRGREFFELKRQFDPEEILQNEFYLKYGAAPTLPD